MKIFKDLLFNKSYCSFFLEKNGTFKYKPINRNIDYLCMLKKFKYAMKLK